MTVNLGTPAVATAVTHWTRLTDLEEQHRVDQTAEPELGMVGPMHRWARGGSLRATLEDTELAAGDFVRWTKQVIDLLDQVASIRGLDAQTRTGCQRAVDLIRRGVVVQSVLEDPEP